MATRPLPRNVGGLERLGCLALGAFLLARGMCSRRALRTAAGAMFLYRGLTGHCQAYRALGFDSRPAAERG